MDATERFFSKVEFTDSCWRWKAYKRPHGYGQFWCNGKDIYAHRWSYEFFVGPIDDSLVIDHLCRTRDCVNPDHLEAVTNQINVIRGKKSTCPQGHELTGDNLYVYPNGHRRCKTCRRSQLREHRNRKVV